MRFDRKQPMQATFFMPSHLDVQIGEYEAAAVANENAIVVDEKYVNYADARGKLRDLCRLHLPRLPYAHICCDVGRHEGAFTCRSTQATSFSERHIIATPGRAADLDLFHCAIYHAMISSACGKI